MELDPTKNKDFYPYIWKQLIEKVERQTAYNEIIKRIETETVSKLNDPGIKNNDRSNPNAVDKVDDVFHNFSNKTEQSENSAQNSIAGPEKVKRGNKHGKNMRRLTKLVSAAFLNPLHIPWDMEDYYYQHVKGHQDKKRIRFPNPSFGRFSDPLTVVDVKGRIVLWYLPVLLSEEQQSCVKESAVAIEPILKKSIMKEHPNKTTPNWRTHDINFIKKGSINTIEPGAINFSAGWLGQGHTSEKYSLLPSLNLRDHYLRETSNWLKISNDLEQFLNFTLSLINPDLFQSGLEMLRRLRDLDETKDIAQKWQSVYTGISVICNRKTPFHRDTKGRPEWFDVLSSYSDPSTTPRLVLEDIGLDLQYSSGTVVGFCGSVLKHGVEAWGVGDRICYAHFMRESVRDRLDVTPAGWVYRHNYLPDLKKTSHDDDMCVIGDLENDPMDVN